MALGTPLVMDGPHTEVDELAAVSGHKAGSFGSGN